MLICDLCRKQLGQKYVVVNEKSHICSDCIKICVNIAKDPTKTGVVYLNEYKEEMERKN